MKLEFIYSTKWVTINQSYIEKRKIITVCITIDLVIIKFSNLL